VECIVDEKTVEGHNDKKVIWYRVGYGPDEDTCETRRNLKNAPEKLRTWNEDSRKAALVASRNAKGPKIDLNENKI